MRILVSGSRDWEDRGLIYRELDQMWDLASGRFVLVHGACPTGADQVAQEWGDSRHGVTVERHRAEWDKHGKAAGMLRNIEMVELGADICLAFIKNNSRGATHCADRAEAAGIPTRRYRA